MLEKNTISFQFQLQNRIKYYYKCLVRVSGIFLSHFKSSTVLVTTLSLCHYRQPILSNDTAFARGPIWPRVPSLQEPRGECDHWACQCSSYQSWASHDGGPDIRLNHGMPHLEDPHDGAGFHDAPDAPEPGVLLSPHVCNAEDTAVSAPGHWMSTTDTTTDWHCRPLLSVSCAAGPASHYHYQLCFGLGPPGGEWCLAGE